MNAPWRTRFDGSSELPTQVDVTIIGGGIAGCATALYLAREGVSVCVLERQQLGEGATGRCLGLPWLGLGDSPIRLERAMGATATDRVLQLCIENRALLSEFASPTATHTTWIALDEREAEEITASRASSSGSMISSSSPVSR